MHGDITASYSFHGDLQTLLRWRWRDCNPIRLPVTRSASIKDTVEAFGLPHTEIEQILCNGDPVDFSWRVVPGNHFDIHPITPKWDVFTPNLLRPVPLTDLRFLVDTNVGGLARYLRMAGLDTTYNPDWDNETLLALLHHERRMLLTRDLGLLKRKQVDFGHFIRADRPVEQLREVLNLFGLKPQEKSFTRCLVCNTLLRPVPKKEILHRLEPLTIRYYEVFFLCPHCDKIFWTGSHVERMQHSLDLP